MHSERQMILVRVTPHWPKCWTQHHTACFHDDEYVYTHVHIMYLINSFSVSNAQQLGRSIEQPIGKQSTGLCLLAPENACRRCDLSNWTRAQDLFLSFTRCHSELEFRNLISIMLHHIQKHSSCHHKVHHAIEIVGPSFLCYFIFPASAPTLCHFRYIRSASFKMCIALRILQSFTTIW